MDPAWITTGIALATVVITVFSFGLRWLWRIGQRTTHFMDDYFGEPARAGTPARPGSMERLANVEQTTQKILHEVTLNSGSSVKDVVARTETAVAELRLRVDSIARQVGNLPGGNP